MTFQSCKGLVCWVFLNSGVKLVLPVHRLIHFTICLAPSLMVHVSAPMSPHSWEGHPCRAWSSAVPDILCLLWSSFYIVIYQFYLVMFPQCIYCLCIHLLIGVFFWIHVTLLYNMCNVRQGNYILHWYFFITGTLTVMESMLIILSYGRD